SVGAGQNAYFDPDVANLIEGTAIGAALLLDYGLAEDSFAQSFVIGFQLGFRFFVVFRKRGLQFFFEFADQVVAFSFWVLLSVEAVGQVTPNLLFQIVVILLIEFRRGHFPLLLSGFFAQLIDRSADLFDFGVRELDRINHR